MGQRITTRIGGQLVEQTAANIQDAAIRRGVRVPTTPAGAEGIGTGPDAAKMAGVPAQRRAIREREVAPEEDLARQRRLARARTKPAIPEEEARMKAQELSTLGSLGTRVQALIQKKFKLDEEATGRINTQRLEGMAPSKQAEAQALLEQYINAPEDLEVLASINNFWADNNLGTFNPNEWIRTGRAVVGEEAAAQVADTMALGELDLEPDELSALNEQFGEAWKAWTVPELEAQIQDLQQLEFERIEGLKSQLAGATGAQRQLLLQELRDLGQVGVTGVEAGVDELQRQIDEADVVEFAGREYSVEDLLKDDTVTDLVAQYFAEEEGSEFRRSLEEENPDFATWIKQNEGVLKELASTARESQERLEEIQEEKQALAIIDEDEGISLNNKVMESLMGEDWGRFTATVPDISDEGLMQLLNSNLLATEKRNEIVNALNGASTATLNEISDMEAPEIEFSFDSYKELLTSPELYQDLLDIDLAQIDQFIVDDDMQKDIARYKPSVAALESFSEKEGFGHVTQWMADNEFKEILKDGQVNADNIEELIYNPRHFDEYKDYKENIRGIDRLERITTTGGDYINEVLSFVFGEPTDYKIVQGEFEKAKVSEKFMPWGEGAKKARSLRELIDANDDGYIQESDARTLFEKIKEDLGYDDQADFSSIFSGEDADKAEFNTRTKSLADSLHRATLNPNIGYVGDMKKITNMTTDKITEGEIRDLYNKGKIDTLRQMFDHWTHYKDLLPAEFRRGDGLRHLELKMAAERRAKAQKNLEGFKSTVSSSLGINWGNMQAELDRFAAVGAGSDPAYFSNTATNRDIKRRLIGERETKITQLKNYEFRLQQIINTTDKQEVVEAFRSEWNKAVGIRQKYEQNVNAMKDDLAREVKYQTLRLKKQKGFWERF